MIRSPIALAALIGEGRTIARLAELEGRTKFRWVMTDTNEPVHFAAVKRVVWSGAVAVVAKDICGDPIQLGRAELLREAAQVVS
jgi:hypothetical protein